MQIRTKLTLQFLLLGGIIMIAASVSIYIAARSFLRNDFFDILRSRAISITQTVLDSYEYSANRALRTGVLQNEKIMILNLRNDTLYISDRNWKTYLTNGIVEQVKLKDRVFYIKDQYSVLGTLYTSGINRFVVIIAAIDKDGPVRLKELRILLIIVYLTGLILFFIAGWFYSGRALKPISEMVKEVEDISITSLHLRVNEGTGNDEIGRLAKTFNNMLERLETSFAMQKNFIANASHELRTPLTSINGQLEVLLMKDRTTEEYKQALSSVLEDIKSMINLSNRLLLIAGLSSEGPSYYSKNIRIDEILWQAQEEFKKINPDCHIIINMDDSVSDSDQMKICGDEYLLKVAVSNIIENACKYSSDRTVNIRFGYRDKMIEVVFEDKGIGIPGEEVQKVFEPFYRATNVISIPGSGIGLSLVNQIIKNHNGAIGISSKIGKGTIVTITLPAIR